MLGRRTANVIRYFLDEWIPPAIRDSKLFMYPLCFICFKGKNVSKNMDFKSVYHTLSDAEFSQYYDEYAFIGKRKADISQASLRYTISQLGDNKKAKILDVGCGEGYVLENIRQLGYTNLLGVDIVMRSKYPNIKIKQASIEHLPFKDKTFDIVMSNHVLEHVLDLPQAVKELKRVTKKKLIITVPKQRYYKYTFDLHVNFFPQISFLLKIINEPPEKITYVNLHGDWTVVVHLD